MVSGGGSGFVVILSLAVVVERPGWLNELGSWIYLTTHTSLSPIRRVFAPGFVNYKKGALDSQPQVIKFTSCFPMVGGSLRVLRLLPPPCYYSTRYKFSHVL
jgi:hypothetical protein